MFKVCGVLVLWAVLLFGAEPGYKFKETPTKFDAVSNQEIDINLRSYLNDPNYPNPLQWSMKGNPSWLTLDAASGKLHGTPPVTGGGPHNFTMSVSANEGGELNHPCLLTVFAPPKWESDRIDLGIQIESEPWTFDLTKHLTDASGMALTFDATNLPAWMSLDQNTGTLSGTPARKDARKYDNIVLTAHGKGGFASAIGFGEAKIKIKPPKWMKDEFALDEANEDSPYNQNIKSFVLNYEETDLTFEVVTQTPPSWLDVGKTSGVLFGTPHKPNLGPVSVAVIFRTSVLGVTYDGTATFKLNVKHVAHPPHWVANPILLPQGNTKISYAQDLSNSVINPDGDNVTFSITSFNGLGTAWATIDANLGVLSGTPQKNNVGENSWVLTATNTSGLSDSTTVKANIKKSKEPPYWLNHPTNLPTAREDKSYQVDLTEFATDPDGAQMIFEKISGPSWVTITANGQLTGTPHAEALPLAKIQARVSDGISGSDATDLFIAIDHTIHPPIFLLDPILLTVTEDQPMREDISGYAKSPDNSPMEFTILEGKPWAQLSKNGVFTGTPHENEVGKNTYRVRLTDTKQNVSTDGTVIISVLHVNHKPSWAQDPVVLPSGYEGTAYSQDLKDFVKDPDLPNDSETFLKISGPDWATVTPSGIFNGNPKRQNVGLNIFTVRVTDKAGESAVAAVQVTIIRVTQPPHWRPVPLGDAYEDTPYTFDLTSYAVADEDDALVFSKVSGPDWLIVDSNGMAHGTPAHKDIGPFTAVFRAADGDKTADGTGTGQVLHKNHPPTISDKLTEFEIKERQVFNVNLVPDYVMDSDSDTLSFELEDTSDFVTLSTSGAVEARPLFKHVNQHFAYRFKVSDGLLLVHGLLKFTVVRDPRPPVWLQDPINMEAQTNQPFTGSIASYAKDLDGIRLTFKKVSGSGWLSVDSDGNLTGTPLDADLGRNEFKVSTCNDLLCADALLVITVKLGTKVDTVQVDTPVPGARSENIWIVDNSKWCDKTIKQFKQDINIYFDDLKAKDIHHTGIYLSADAHRWDGLPIHEDGKSLLMKYNDSNLANDFRRRVDLGWSPDRCSNCFNSPIWSMYRLLERLPVQLSEIYHRDFMMPDVPMDVFILTHQRDHYKYFTKNVPDVKDWTPTDYAQHFIQFHTQEKKGLRISDLTPQINANELRCPGLTDASDTPASLAPANAYETLVEETKGTHYGISCDTDLKAYLHDYAKKVAFRATVHAKTHIPLSATPLSVNSIKVSVGGVELSSDKWEYNANANEVILHWNLIDHGQIKPGDVIRIEYRVS